MQSPFTGLTAAVHTPMHADGSLWLEQIEPLVAHLADIDVSALYVCGSTGESASLTSSERKKVAEAFASVAAGRFPVAVQVGHNCLQESCELAAHAQRIGVAAISATAPSYFKPDNGDILLECLAMIANSAPELPFYYYHIPTLVDVRVDIPTLLKRAQSRVPSFRGVKFTSAAIWEYQACVGVDQGYFDCLFGLDEMLLPALSVGARGAIGSTYNFAAPVYHQLIAAFARGDLQEARLMQDRAIRMIRTLTQHGGMPAIKATMKLVGIDCGPTRLPLARLSTDAIGQLERDMSDVGLFAWLDQAKNTDAATDECVSALRT